MLPKLRLLISGLILSASAQAGTELSGFAYTTQFSDKDWQDSRSVVAMNIDSMNDLFDVRSQVSTYMDSPIRRLTVEKSVGKNGVELVAKVGRFSHVDSFFANITDNPAGFGMAVLPMGGYNYRMVNGAFVIMDGVKLDISTRNDGHLTTLHLSEGYMVIPTQHDMQMEVFHKTYDGIRIDATLGKTVELHDEFGNWHVYAAYYDYNAELTKTANTATTAYLVSNFSVLEYTLRKLGVKWDDGSYYLITEYGAGWTQSETRAGKITSKLDAEDHYVVVGKYLTDSTKAYAGHTLGRNHTGNTTNEDSWVGLTSKCGKVTASVDYHVGYGAGWQQYDTASVSRTHNSFVTSITYQF